MVGRRFVRLGRQELFTPVVDESQPVRIPITGELDLHNFQPAEVASLIDEYFHECRKRGLADVRIIHGKGTGTLRETVHALLRRSTLVASFRLGNETSGGWGATVVTLKVPPR
jgi:dsDNA-specific endonuclease/ATPase MutS2